MQAPVIKIFFPDNCATFQRSAQALSHQALLRLGVKQRIQNLSDFNDVLSQSSFQNETGLLEHTSRSRIIHVGLGVNAIQLKVRETVICKGGHGFTCDAVSPEVFT
jgi:hypothetical protein